MGGVWCKADKGHGGSYSPRGPFNTAIARWTDHIRQAYRRPKQHHRPPRPPQKPLRSNDKLTISAPTLMKDASSDGWRTATLVVPEAAPVPPPRKKRKRNRELARTSYSMDDLNQQPTESLNKSTISLPDRYHSDTLDSKSSSSTLVVTPILESRTNHPTEKSDKLPDDNKEIIKTELESKLEEEDEDEIDTMDQPEIIPIEKEILFSPRTLLYSTLGYVDKLSAISEVSAESGFDDKTDNLRSSEGTESVASSESSQRDGLNILAHLKNINNVNHINEESIDIREKTEISKKEWLQNILKGDPEPYSISEDEGNRKGSDGVTQNDKKESMCEEAISLPTEHLHAMNKDNKPSEQDYVSDQTSQDLTPSTGNNSNHSVLLDIIQKNTEINSPLNPYEHKEESIFLTNTKTNIIYKSLSSDKLTDEYDDDFIIDKNTMHSVGSDVKQDRINFSLDSNNQFNSRTPTPKSHLSDYSFQTPKLVESNFGVNSSITSNIVSSFDFKELGKATSQTTTNYVTALNNLQLSVNEKANSVNKESEVLVNGVNVCMKNNTSIISNENKTSEKPSTKALSTNSLPSSRRSSITDSLHEFELSIYDMLKESKKNENSSDEEDSLKTVK